MSTVSTKPPMKQRVAPWKAGGGVALGCMEPKAEGGGGEKRREAGGKKRKAKRAQRDLCTYDHQSSKDNYIKYQIGNTLQNNKIKKQSLNYKSTAVKSLKKIE